jgi:hypothetical protein
VDFGTVIVLVVLLVLPVAAALFIGAFELLDQLGKGEFAIEERPVSPPPPPGSTMARREREEEIRQLVQARHDRRLARGESGIDVEGEVRRLLELDADEPEEERRAAALREEVRQLVIARNDRRAARGEPPLDVEAQIDRQLRDLPR